VFSTTTNVYALSQLTISGQTVTIQTQSGAPASSIICLVFSTLQNPFSTQPTSSFTITTRRSQFLIDQLTTGATYTPSTGTLSGVTITPDSTTIYASTVYQITFTLANGLASDGYFTITFPSALELSLSSCSLSQAQLRSSPTCSTSG
jgi:hypothetical protein